MDQQNPWMSQIGSATKRPISDFDRQKPETFGSIGKSSLIRAIHGRKVQKTLKKVETPK
jgi:hypothetical protein